jgi:hypothetical protein
MVVGQPPRVVDASLLKGLKQVDFVGYVANPRSRRGAARGEASRLVAPLRNARLQRKPDDE